MSTPRRGRRAVRFMRRTLIFLTVGLGINIAVSWGLAAWLPQENWQAERVGERGKRNDRFSLFMTNYHTVGACRRAWNVERLGWDRSFPAFRTAIENSPTVYSSDDNRPLRGIGWGCAEAARSDPEAFAPDGCEHATGWPLLTAWCGFTLDWKVPTTPVVLEWGIPIFDPAKEGSYPPETSKLRALPLRPIWIGLAVNSIFYAAISCGLWQGTLAIRKTLRRARGQCVGCSYNLAGLPTTSLCPECGLARGVDGVTT